MSFILNSTSKRITPHNLWSNTLAINEFIKHISSDLRIIKTSNHETWINITEILKIQNQNSEKDLPADINPLKATKDALDVIAENLKQARETSLAGFDYTHTSTKELSITLEDDPSILLTISEDHLPTIPLDSAPSKLKDKRQAIRIENRKASHLHIKDLNLAIEGISRKERSVYHHRPDKSTYDDKQITLTDRFDNDLTVKDR